MDTYYKLVFNYASILRNLYSVGGIRLNKDIFQRITLADLLAPHEPFDLFPSTCTPNRSD